MNLKIRPKGLLALAPALSAPAAGCGKDSGNSPAGANSDDATASASPRAMPLVKEEGEWKLAFGRPRGGAAVR